MSESAPVWALFDDLLEPLALESPWGLLAQPVKTRADAATMAANLVGKGRTFMMFWTLLSGTVATVAARGSAISTVN